MSAITITCLSCRHAFQVAAKSGCECAADDVYRCLECGARMAFGKLMPRIVIEPFVDERGIRWVRKRYQDPITKADLYVVDVDREYALMEAKQILSLVTL